MHFPDYAGRAPSPGSWGVSRKWVRVTVCWWAAPPSKPQSGSQTPAMLNLCPGASLSRDVPARPRRSPEAGNSSGPFVHGFLSCPSPTPALCTEAKGHCTRTPTEPKSDVGPSGWCGEHCLSGCSSAHFLFSSLVGKVWRAPAGGGEGPGHPVNTLISAEAQSLPLGPLS